MLRRSAALWVVECLSLSRLIAAVLFASIAFQSIPKAVVCGLYLFAVLSDTVDGFIARTLHADTYFGRIVDLVSDKSLTIVSLLYAAARGIDLAPLAIIAVREIVMIGARIITIQGRHLLPTSKVLGTIMALLLWGNTFFLIMVRSSELVRLSTKIYWACALVVSLNLVIRILKNTARIQIALDQKDDH
jgi:phosphatidylglycerophosphate synthase